MVALPPKVGGLTAASMPLGPDGFPLPPEKSGNKIVDDALLKMYNEKKQEFLAQKAREAAQATPAPIAPAAPAPKLQAAPEQPVKERRKPKLPGNEPPYEVQHQIIQVGEHVWEFTHKGKLTFPDGTQQLTAAAPAGAMNCATYYAPVTPLITSATGQTLAQYTFTTNGNPVLCIANGDANPLSTGGNWRQIQWYRDGAPIGNKFHLENNQNINPGYCATVLDTPAAGPHVYSLRIVSGVYNGSWIFGGAAGPILTFVELAGAVGPKGDPGVGASTTQVQNSITLDAITTAPAVGKRTIDRIVTGKQIGRAHV